MMIQFGIFLRVSFHKKRKNSLETWAELAVIRTCVENKAILENILPSRGSKI